MLLRNQVSNCAQTCSIRLQSASACHRANSNVVFPCLYKLVSSLPLKATDIQLMAQSHIESTTTYSVLHDAFVPPASGQ